MMVLAMIVVLIKHIKTELYAKIVIILARLVLVVRIIIAIVVLENLCFIMDSVLINALMMLLYKLISSVKIAP